jgi:uncharacterized protein
MREFVLLEGVPLMLLRYLEIEEPSHYSEKIEEQELEMGYNYSAKVKPIEFEMEVTPLQKGCLIEGDFDYEVILPCARCMEPVVISDTATFAIELKPRSALNIPENEADAEMDDADEVFIEGDVFDTSELVKEQMYLLLPERVLCEDECRGLCPNCGANLNETKCKCPEAKDPRWAELNKLD